MSSPDLGIQVAGTHCVLPRVGGSSGGVTELGAGQGSAVRGLPRRASCTLRGTHLRLCSTRVPVYGRLNDGPKGVHVLIPRAWDEVSSHWTDGARSRTHRWDTEGGGSGGSRGWIMEAGPRAGGCAHLGKLEGARSSFPQECPDGQASA